MKKRLIIILSLTVILFVSGCSLEIKTNKELKEEQKIYSIISGLQQKVESLNEEITMAQQKLNGLKLQKQISDLQAENAKLKKTTTTKAVTTTTNTRAIQQAMKRAINEQAECRSYKTAHPEAYLMSCD